MGGRGSIGDRESNVNIETTGFSLLCHLCFLDQADDVNYFMYLGQVTEAVIQLREQFQQQAV